MSTQFFKYAGAYLILALCAPLVLAHTSAISTTPKSGSILEASPPTISITFKEAARLTSVSVANVEAKSQRKLTFSPNSSATEFKVEHPQLAPGKNVVSWAALSKDGHVVKGAIVLTVKAPANQTN